MLEKLSLMLVVVTACTGGSAAADNSDIADLPAITATEFEAHLAGLDKPAVVNVWASWCVPCRSEAPLLDEAYAQHGDEIEFIGVDVQDSQGGAKHFWRSSGSASTTSSIATVPYRTSTVAWALRSPCSSPPMVSS